MPVQKITFGEMRSNRGPTRILVYCANYQCSHSIEMSADRWPDDVRLSDLEPRFVCRACGKRGADVRPHFEPARMGTNVSNAGTLAKDQNRCAVYHWKNAHE